MLSLGAIRQLAIEAGDEARENGLEPFVYFNEDEVDYFDTFPFPFLGDYVPDEWELVEQHFVDSSGFGSPSEPAHTAEQFKDYLRRTVRDVRGRGWAVTEAGQFQVYVGEYRRTP